MGPMDQGLAERNRELISKRLGWPPGALECCRRLEKAWPRFQVWWAKSDTLENRGPGYRANWLQGERQHGDRTLFARTAQEMHQILRLLNDSRPPWQAITPLIPIQDEGPGR